METRSLDEILAEIRGEIEADRNLAKAVNERFRHPIDWSAYAGNSSYD
jgi:hypothetical protein